MSDDKGRAIELILMVYTGTGVANMEINMQGNGVSRPFGLQRARIRAHIFGLWDGGGVVNMEINMQGNGVSRSFGL
jgi:hypothetical protein